MRNKKLSMPLTGRGAAKSVLAIFFVALFYFGATGVARNSNAHWVNVEKAIDGDTLRLDDGRRVRLIGIDTREIDHREGTAEPWAVEAWHALGRLVNGRKARLDFGPDRHDAHGRLLAYVFNEEGDLINRQMIDQGLAHVLYVAPNVGAYQALLDAQRTAMASQKGIWRTLSNTGGPWVGNRHSKRFHQARCPSARKIHPRNAVRLNSRTEAFYQGYAPCKRCLSIPKKELKHLEGISAL